MVRGFSAFTAKSGGVGGHPRRQIVEAIEFHCEDEGDEAGDCAAVMELLFTVSSGGETGVDVGRAGELRIFRCPADARHGVQVDLH